MTAYADIYDRYHSHWASTWNARVRRKYFASYEALDMGRLLERRFGGANAYVVRKMIVAIGAVRGICRHKESDQYEEDIEQFGDNGTDADDLREMLSISGFSSREIEDWFERASEKDYVITLEDELHSTDNCNYCERYEKYTTGSTNTVRIARRTTEQWSEDACNEYAFYCEVSEQHYSDSHYSSDETEDGRVICRQYANDNGWYWHDGPEVFCEYPEDDDDDEDDDEGGSGIPAYHRGARDWDQTLVIANRSTRGFYGFEIELDFGNSDRRRRFWNEHLDGSVDFCGEHDGSLSDYSGMEIVTRPFPLQELRSLDCPLRKLMAEAEEAGAIGVPGTYGVHVTTNWGRLDENHKKRMRHMVYALHRMSEYIAGRRGTGYCSYGNEHGAENHWTAVHIRNKQAVEFRIFQSTTDYNTLLSYAEFVDAVTEYTRDPNRVTQGPLAGSLFRHWVALGGQYPALAARFPTPSCKEMLPCVLPSSSRPEKSSRKMSCAPVSKTTPTDVVSLSSETARSMFVPF